MKKPENLYCHLIIETNVISIISVAQYSSCCHNLNRKNTFKSGQCVHSRLITSLMPPPYYTEETGQAVLHLILRDA